jgi:hypothetical protein
MLSRGSKIQKRLEKHRRAPIRKERWKEAQRSQALNQRREQEN